MQFRPTENRSEPSFHGSYVELVLLPVADPRGVCAEEEEGGRVPACIGIPPDEQAELCKGSCGGNVGPGKK